MDGKTCENCVFCDVNKLDSDPCYSCNDDDKWEPKKSTLRYEVAALRRQLEERRVVVPAPEHSAAFKREDRYLVLKRADLEHHATPAQLRELKRICEMVRIGRMTEGKRLNSYVVVADDWPEYEETWARIQARMTGTQIQDIRPLSSGEVVATPLTDVVTVPREEWETMHEFLSEWVLLQWADDPRGDGDPAPHRKRIDELFERLDALRSGEAGKGAG